MAQSGAIPPSPDHMDAYFTLLGALAGGGVTAVAGHFRQKSQLRDERERLDRQLWHDREMRDLEELRSLLDKISDSVEAFVGALLTCSVDWRLELAPEEHRRRKAELISRYEQVVIFERRLAFRLAPDSRLALAFETTVTAAAAAIEVLRDHEPPMTEQARLSFVEAQTALARSHKEFILEAQQVVGIRTPPR